MKMWVLSFGEKRNMAENLNKKCILYSYIVMAFSSVQFCFGSAALNINKNEGLTKEQMQQQFKQMLDWCTIQLQQQCQKETNFRKLVLINSWNAHASLFVNDPKRKEWYNDGMYSNSIYKVIAEEIADCVTASKEYAYAFKNDIQIVEYATKPSDLKDGYSQENWNAVVLRNYLAGAIHGYKKWNKNGINDSCVEEAGKSIKNFYKNIEGIEGFINKAVADIKEYAKALDLYGYIEKVKQLPNEDTWDKQQAPDTTVQAAYSYTNAGSEFCIKEAYVIDKDERFKTPINLVVRNGEVIKVITNRGSYKSIFYGMRLEEKLDVNEGLLHNIENKDFLKKTKIRNLLNLKNEQRPLSNGKCYFNSVMQALNAAAPFRMAVKQILDNKGDKAIDQNIVNGVRALCEFMEGIQQGKMQYKPNENNSKAQELYEEKIFQLATAIEWMRINNVLKDNKCHNNHLSIAEKVKQNYDSYNTTFGKHKLRRAGGANVHEMLDDILSLVETGLAESGLLDITRKRNITKWPNGELTVANPMLNSTNTAYVSYEIREEADVTEVITNDLAKITDNIELPCIKILPELFIVIVRSKGNNEPYEIQWEDYMDLTDNEGKKRYLLVSTVDKKYKSEHFVATIRTDKGWAVVDDQYGNKGAQFATTYWDNELRQPCILVYQRCK